MFGSFTSAPRRMATAVGGVTGVAAVRVARSVMAASPLRAWRSRRKNTGPLAAPWVMLLPAMTVSARP